MEWVKDSRKLQPNTQEVWQETRLIWGHTSEWHERKSPLRSL
jgi:hypothetical protein